MNTDAGLDVMMAMAVLRDLQHQVAVMHRFVIADNAVLLNPEDVTQIAGEEHKCTVVAHKLNGKVGVVVRQEHLLEKSAGRLYVQVPARRNSRGSRPCKALNVRSERPRASSEQAEMSSIPSY